MRARPAPKLASPPPRRIDSLKRSMRSPSRSSNRRRQMRTIAMVLSVCAFAVQVWADTPATSSMPSTSSTSSTDASAVAAIRQLGQDMGDAMVHVDIDTLDKMFGDDWVSVGASGTVFTKQSLMNDMKIGKKRLTWFELHPIDVQVYGDTAIAPGK